MRTSFSSFVLCSWVVSACLSPSVQAQTRVIGASLPVLASEGDEVILPCRCDPPRNLRLLTVEWSRTEIKQDPSGRQSFVHVYTDQRHDTDMKIREFVNRTQLFPEHFADGNASLQIRRVALSDNGTYKCLIPNLLKEPLATPATLVTLIVLPAEEVFPNETENTEPKLNNLLPLRSHLAIIIIPLVLVFFTDSVVVFVIIRERFCKRPDVENPLENTDQRQVSEKEEQKLITVHPTEDTKNTGQGG